MPTASASSGTFCSRKRGVRSMRSSSKRRSWNCTGQPAAARLPAASSATTWILGFGGASRGIA